MTEMRTVMWQAIQWTGLEYCTLAAGPDGFRADSQLVGFYEDRPYSLHYQIQTDDQWRVRNVLIRTDTTDQIKLHLTSNGRGQWCTQEGIALPELAGCLDIDLSLSPFTNTLPIRRLRFHSEQLQRINVVYIELPEGKISRVEQLYTQLTDACYQFQQPALSFSAELPIDTDGLVIDYPNLFRRVY